MKKILTSVAVCFFSFSFISNAQSFQQGSLIVALAYGFDGYAVQEHEVNNYYSPSQTVNVTNGAGSGNLNLGGEYGVTKWLGLGLQFKFDSYLHNSNVIQANGFEYGIIANAHIVRHPHFDFLAGINLGLSSLTITWNDGYNDQIYGSGTWDDIHFTARVYVGKFGFSATFYLPVINYSTLTFNNNLLNEYIADSWKARGEGLNIGVQYHFLK